MRYRIIAAFCLIPFLVAGSGQRSVAVPASGGTPSFIYDSVASDGGTDAACTGFNTTNQTDASGLAVLVTVYGAGGKTSAPLISNFPVEDGASYNPFVASGIGAVSIISTGSAFTCNAGPYSTK